MWLKIVRRKYTVQELGTYIYIYIYIQVKVRDILKQSNYALKNFKKKNVKKILYIKNSSKGYGVLKNLKKEMKISY